MAEFSYFWTTTDTGPTGDQVANYTQVHLARISDILGSCMGFEGVAQNYRNQLKATVTGANTVRFGTGQALVDGKPYLNNSTVDINIPSAVGGGNTRIDRLVLRANWSAYTVRITRIAGTDAASPTAPAITQTTGVTYDIALYQALVDTSGNVTLTDERVFAGFLVGRIGFSANSWYETDPFGTLGETARATDKFSIQVGVQQTTDSYSPRETNTEVITFPQAFSYAPIVYAVTDHPQISCGIDDCSASDVTIKVYYAGEPEDPNYNPAIYWMAIGPRT